MSIVADLKAVKQVLDDVEAIESGPVTIAVSGTLQIAVTAANGTKLLDTTVQINQSVSPGNPPT